jgi:hypothetical protein
MFTVKTITHNKLRILGVPEEKILDVKTYEPAEYTDLPQIAIAIERLFAIFPGATAHIYYREDGLGRVILIENEGELEKFHALCHTPEFNAKINSEECFTVELEVLS